VIFLKPATGSFNGYHVFWGGGYIPEDYAEIFSFQNLYAAHMAARKSKRHKKDVILFEMDLGNNLWRLNECLINREYIIQDYNKFTVYEPKKREIQALSYADRIIQHALCDNYLYPFLAKRFFYDNCACQKGKGTDFGRDRLTGFMREHYKANGNKGYILKADIKGFFANIDHYVLKRKLNKAISNQDVMELLEMIINSFNSDTGRGLPMGNQTSQLFALYYLDPLDRLIKEKLKIKHFTRYMDDCVLIHPDKEYLKFCLQQMTKLVEDDLKLEFNQKTQIFPISEGVDYLGFHFYLTDTSKVVRKLRQSSKIRFKKRLKVMQQGYYAGTMEFDAIKRSLASYNGHLTHGNTWNLKKSVYSRFVLKRNWDSEKKPL
jgi:retron-type reverse transcriptase